MSRGWLGLAWALTTATATIGGPVWLAGWLLLGASAAAAQVAVSSGRERRRSLLTGAAGATAGLLTLSALGGLGAMGVGIAAGVLVLLLGRAGGKTAAAAAEATRVLLAAVVIGTAMGSVVLLCDRKPEAVLFLLACAGAYDTGAYLVGTGASSWWEGPVAGMAAVIPVTLFAESLNTLPGTWQAVQLGIMAAGLAPAGPLVARALLGPGVADRRAPTLRRIDSLLVVGPVWIVFALRFLAGPPGS